MLLDPLLKEVFRRRPLNEGSDGYSFPSGSAMVSLAVLIALVLTFPAARRTGIALAGTALVAAQGAILVSARWHYASDVVAGWSFSVAWVLLVRAIMFAGTGTDPTAAAGTVGWGPRERGLAEVHQTRHHPVEDSVDDSARAAPRAVPRTREPLTDKVEVDERRLGA